MGHTSIFLNEREVKIFEEALLELPKGDFYNIIESIISVYAEDKFQPVDLFSKPVPVPPKLDFGGKTTEDRLWKTIDGHVVLVDQFDYRNRSWECYHVLMDGSFEDFPNWPNAGAKCFHFTEDGDNQELGYLKDRKRGSEVNGWPTKVKELPK